MKFNIRIDNLEIRSCNETLLSGGDHTTAEVVKWDGEERPNCYTIAYWSKGGEGYELQFVGNRPFDVDEKLFMELAKYGQLILDGYFNLENKWDLTE
jgi:hypothetical protein